MVKCIKVKISLVQTTSRKETMMEKEGPTEYEYQRSKEFKELAIHLLGKHYNYMDIVFAPGVDPWNMERELDRLERMLEEANAITEDEKFSVYLDWSGGRGSIP